MQDSGATLGSKVESGLSAQAVSSSAAAAKSLQSCLTLCDPIDGSPPHSPMPGSLQARTLEWVAISFSNAWKWKVKVKSLSHVWLSATPRTAAYQAPPSMGFSRQEYWSGVPLPSLSLVTSKIQIKITGGITTLLLELEKNNHLVWSSLGPFILLQAELFHSLL